jgi:hypothetical protein
MHSSVRVLIFGASYGSLLASKLLLAGTRRRSSAFLPNPSSSTRKAFASACPFAAARVDRARLAAAEGSLSASGPASVDPSQFDLVVLAMQEPQYRAAGVRELLDAVARAKVPCMSIMNMPPPPFLARIPGLDMAACRSCYTDAPSGTASSPGS